MGESFDAIHTLNSSLVTDLDILSGDYYAASVGYGHAVTNVIKKIVRKSIRQDTTEDVLDAKKDRLLKYETSEEEALRIGVVLESEGGRSVVPNSNAPTGIIAKMNALMDRDPEVTRRNSISRLRDEIKTGDVDVVRGRQEVSFYAMSLMIQGYGYES